MKFQQIGDKAAIGISLLCVMHCLLTPIVMLLIPPLSAVLALNHEAFHTWLLFAVLPVSTIALLLGYLHHHSRYVFLIGVIGLAILVVAALAGHDSLGKYGEVVLTILGSGVIAYGHIRNYQLGRQQRSVKTH